MTGLVDPDVRHMVDCYIARTEEYAIQLGSINRFYAYLADDLQGLEWAIQEADPTEELLYRKLLALYARWLDDMAPQERQSLFKYNREQTGECRNHLLEENLERR